MEAVYSEMLHQFRPKIDQPLSLEEVREMLTDAMSHWASLHAMITWLCATGEFEEAGRLYTDEWRRRMYGGTDWELARTAELDEVLIGKQNASAMRSVLATRSENALEFLKVKSLFG